MSFTHPRCWSPVIFSEASTVWSIDSPKVQRLGVWYSVDIFFQNPGVRLFAKQTDVFSKPQFFCSHCLNLWFSFWNPMLFPIYFLLNIKIHMYSILFPESFFFQLSHGLSVYLSVTSVISKAPTMDPAMPPHRPWPQTGSCGTCFWKWMAIYGRWMLAFASSRFKRDPCLKRGDMDMFLP